MEPVYIVFIVFKKFKILQNGTLVTIALFLTHPVFAQFVELLSKPLWRSDNLMIYHVSTLYLSAKAHPEPEINFSPIS